jgi:hypothetical protein
MKIKDLPFHQSLTDVRFIYPTDGKPYYWHSQWPKGVWGKKDLHSPQTFPLFCNDLLEALEWDVYVEPKAKPRKRSKSAKGGAK